MEELFEKYRNSHHEFRKNADNDWVLDDPLTPFKRWFEEAAEASEPEANAFVLTTSDLQHQSSGRIVYLKEILEEAYVFYTNYESQKGKEIAMNPKVSMLFYWPTLFKQVRIEGICTKVDPEISDAYFESRPAGSKIGAWASKQSEPLAHREDLEREVRKYEEKFGEEVPRPPFWGGYKITANRYEFWLGRTCRLHDRIIYEKSGDSWMVKRKNP